MFDPQVVVAAVVAPVVAFVAGMFIEDRFMVFPRVRDLVADVKAKFARVKDAVK